MAVVQMGGGVMFSDQLNIVDTVRILCFGMSNELSNSLKAKGQIYPPFEHFVAYDKYERCNPDELWIEISHSLDAFYVTDWESAGGGKTSGGLVLIALGVILAFPTFGGSASLIAIGSILTLTDKKYVFVRGNLDQYTHLHPRVVKN
jgi:hypothetical protein